MSFKGLQLSHNSIFNEQRALLHTLKSSQPRDKKPQSRVPTNFSASEFRYCAVTLFTPLRTVNGFFCRSSRTIPFERTMSKYPTGKSVQELSSVFFPRSTML